MVENQLVEAVSETLATDMRRRLHRLDFTAGDVLAEPNQPIHHLIFPRSGLISIVIEMDNGDPVEVGIVGRQGVLGGAAIFGAERHLHTAIGQLSGTAWTMRVADARELATNSSEFRDFLIANERYLLAEARQFAACNAKHLIAQRLCSWLLRACDEVGASEIRVTQDSMAKMLGVQRATVSVLAGRLQTDELISYRRGQIHVLNPEGLRARACSCYRTLVEHHKSAFAARPHRVTSADD